MSLPAHGDSISDIEVTNISAHGIWLWVRGSEYFLPFELFPWFRDATVSHILHVEELAPGHFHWPDLDVDLGLDSIKHPERFPLMASISQDHKS